MFVHARHLYNLIVCSVAVLTVIGSAPAHAVQDTDRLLLINNLAETMTLIDRAGDSIVPNVLTLGLVPNRIRMATSAILVVNSTSDDLWVIDPNTMVRLRTVTFPDGENPWDVVAINDTLCAVSLLLANDVAFVNYVSGTELGRAHVGTSPEGLAMAGGKLWVANSGFNFNTFTFEPGTVSVVNPVTRAVVATVPVGFNPQSLAFSPDGELHVLCTGDYASHTGIVYVLNPAAITVTDSIPLGSAPGDLAIDRDNMAYVAAGGWADSGQVYRYDAHTHAVLNNSANPWHSARGVTAVLPRLEGGVYALCFDADSVVEHRLNGTVVRAWQVGDGPVSAVYITNRVPGDLNEDGALDVLDVVAAIDFVFNGGAPPVRLGSADVNSDCAVDILDIVAIIDAAFSGAGAFLHWGC